MEAKKSDTDDSYWISSHKGFDFDTFDKHCTADDSKLSAVLRNDELNQLNLLRSEGLTEVVENSSMRGFSSLPISPVEVNSYSSKFSKNFNPLTSSQRRKVECIKYGPEETVKNMVLGLEYSLTKFKGKVEKSSLLDAAVRSHDGSVILEVVLFLRDTLKKSLFQREIVAHPDAVNVYLAYLEEDHETDELTNMLLLSNKAEDAAILKYEAAIIVHHPEEKLKRINNCLSTHFQLGAVDTFLRKSVEEHKRILEEQINLGALSLSETLTLQFEQLTGRKSVIDSSVLCTLIFYYLCNYNLEQKVFLPAITQIKANYNLSKKQFTWAGFRACVASKRWSEVGELFVSKNWLGGTKVRSCIPYRRILQVLFKEKAPLEVLSKCASWVENEQEKLFLAQKYSCHSVAIEVFKNNRDRAGLIKYKASLLPHSVDFCNATDVLNNPMIRWKN